MRSISDWRTPRYSTALHASAVLSASASCIVGAGRNISEPCSTSHVSRVCLASNHHCPYLTPCFALSWTAARQSASRPIEAFCHVLEPLLQNPHKQRVRQGIRVQT